MAFTENNGTKIFWTEQGAGEPLLLIMGLGGSHREWRRIAPKLAEKYRVILFDNRGVGETVFSDEPFSIPLMASDAKAVLDAADVKSAHILGMSMGGMIAQEFALQFPEMTRSLTLDRNRLRRTRSKLQPNPKFISRFKAAAFDTPEDAFWRDGYFYLR